MEYNIEPTDVEVKLGIDDLCLPSELDVAYRRGYQEARLSAKDLYDALKSLLAKATTLPGLNRWEIPYSVLQEAGKATSKAETE